MIKATWALNEPLSEFDRRDAARLVAAMDYEEFRATADIARNAGIRESRARLILPRLSPLAEFRLTKPLNGGRQKYLWRRRRKPLESAGLRILQQTGKGKANAS